MRQGEKAKKKCRGRDLVLQVIAGARTVAVTLDRAMNTANASWTKRSQKYSGPNAQSPENFIKDDGHLDWKELDWKERAVRTDWGSKKSMDNFFPLLEGDYGQLVFPPFIVGMISEPLVRAHSMHRWRRTKPGGNRARAVGLLLINRGQQKTCKATR